MEIFYINLNTFLENIDTSSSNSCLDTKNRKIKERKKQYAIGRFLLEFIAKTRYKIENTEVVVKNEKPYFEFNDINFSISHSKNIVMIAFDEFPTGLDIENLKERDFSKILKYLNVNLKTINKESFYTFWTQYEAKIKLQDKVNNVLTFKFSDNFIVSIASCSHFDIYKRLKIYEITNNQVNNDDNTLTLNEINTDSLEILPSLN